jgi:phosphatidate cytidylyltransferase
VEPVMILFAILILFLVDFDPHSPTASNSISMTAITFFGLVYVGWLTSYFLKLRSIPETGSWWVFFVVFAVKMGDAGAYFVGKKFGRHKLIPHISPNKSIEGAVGCAAVTLVCSLSAKLYLPNVPMIHFLIIGAVLAVLSQLGDLVESLIKRNLGAKDSGVIPGLGGMLDVMDSLFFSVPFVYCYITLVPGLLE